MSIRHGVLFDLDGTLADSAPDLVSALNWALHEKGMSTRPELHLRPHVSHGARCMLAAATGIQDDPLLDEMLTLMLDRYEQNLAVATRLFEGIADLLDDLEHQEIAWGIVTNKTQRFTLPLINALQLNPTDQCVLSGDSLSQKKPHPAPLLEAARLLNCAPENCVYIGDAETDIIAGKAAGMRTAVAAWGYIPMHANPADWQSHLVANTPKDLGFWFKSIHASASHSHS